VHLMWLQLTDLARSRRSLMTSSLLMWLIGVLPRMSTASRSAPWSTRKQAIASHGRSGSDVARSRQIWNPHHIARLPWQRRLPATGPLNLQKLHSKYICSICVSTTSWTLLCITACIRKLRGTWSTVAHQFQKSPVVDHYAQPVDIILLCHCING